jgi:hypothetical protein
MKLLTSLLLFGIAYLVADLTCNFAAESALVITGFMSVWYAYND